MMTGSAKIAAAVALWRSSVDPRKTPVETYLNGRGLELGDDIAGSVLRWAPDIDAMVALFRSIETNRPQAVSRTYLDREGNKLSRKFRGLSPAQRSRLTATTWCSAVCISLKGGSRRR